jgi:hypothetical protein
MLKSYADAGLKYEEHIQDKLFAHFEKTIQNDKNRKETINSLTRIKTPDGEWLTYSCTIEGHDVFGVRHTYFKDNCGEFVKFDVETTHVFNKDAAPAEFDPDNDKPAESNVSLYKEVKNILAERRGFSIAYSKENCDKLHEKCNDSTSYNVANNNRIVNVNDTYENWRDTDFSILFNYGCRPNRDIKERIDMITANRYNITQIPTKTPIAEIGTGLI